MNERRRRRWTPGREEWLGYEADLDVRYAHKLFFGKTLDEVQSIFKDRAKQVLDLVKASDG